MKNTFHLFLALFFLLVSSCQTETREEKLDKEITLAFESLRESLKTNAESKMSSGQAKMEKLRTAVQEEIDRGSDKHALLIPLSEEFHGMTLDLLNYMGKMQEDLEEIAERDPETGELMNKKEVAKSGEYMLGKDPTANAGSGNGAAFQLRQKLVRYVETGNGHLKELDIPLGRWDTLEHVAVHPADDPFADKEARKAGVSWEAYRFSGSPVIATLAVLEQLKMEVLQGEETFMDGLGQMVSGVVFKIDSLIAIGAPVSSVVAAGMKFETKLIVGKSNGDTLQVESTVKEAE